MRWFTPLPMICGLGSRVPTYTVPMPLFATRTAQGVLRSDRREQGSSVTKSESSERLRPAFLSSSLRRLYSACPPAPSIPLCAVNRIFPVLSVSTAPTSGCRRSSSPREFRASAIAAFMAASRARRRILFLQGSAHMVGLDDQGQLLHLQPRRTIRRTRRTL